LTRPLDLRIAISSVGRTLPGSRAVADFASSVEKAAAKRIGAAGSTEAGGSAAVGSNKPVKGSTGEVT
jgi:hypothetical protein